MRNIRIRLSTMDWHDDYLDKARRGDQRVRKLLLRRRCAACREPFLVAPNRPDADFCQRPACRSRRQRERERRKQRRKTPR